MPKLIQCRTTFDYGRIMAQAPSAHAKKMPHLLLLLALLFLSAAVFGNRVADAFRHPESQNTTDMDIFAGAAKNYLDTGQLYMRSDNYTKTYAPGEGVYKFPPAYQLTVLPLLKIYPNNFDFLFAQRVIQLFLYLFTSISLIANIGKAFIWQNSPITDNQHRYRSCQFILTALLVTLWSMGFFDSFSGIEPEIYVFFLLALAMFFLNKKTFIPGMLIAVATAIKIYPVFILLYFVFKRDFKALVGFVVGLLLITLLSIYCVGINEHVFYLKNILPVLLQEKPIYHIQNTTIESLIYAHNLAANMDGLITAITKTVTIVIVFIVGWMSRRQTTQESLLFYSMLTAAILLWMSNYWLQYQIILQIPLFCLLAWSVQKKISAVFIIVIVTAVAMCIYESWFQDIMQKIFSDGLPGRKDDLERFIKAHPESDPILYFFPFLWLLKRMRDMVFLSPAVLFLLSAGILLRQKIRVRISPN